MKNINTKLILGIVIIFIILGYKFLKTNDKNIDNTITYEAIKINSNGGRGYIEVNGHVEVNDTKKVFVDKKLKVEEVFVQEGDYVEKGQLLMTFDETERNNIMRNLEREQLTLRKLERDYKIEKQLNEIGGSPDNTLLEYEEDIRRTQINIEEYMEDLEKTAEEIKSPVSGTITSLTAQENYLVDTDSPLMEIADLSDIKIVLEVPEYDVKNIYLGQSLILKPEVFEKKESFTGVITKISKISEVSEITSENVLTAEVKPDKTIPYIVPGFKVTATIYLDRKVSEILIPKTSAIFENDNYYVFVYNNDGTIKKKNIKVESLKGDNLIVKEGLTFDEIILTTPDISLIDGEKVIIKVKGEKNGNNVRSKQSK
ncbi:efflux RND transporter periplasmic adaptor subunit [Fusobacterium perfoetens]|uniref:efflux RND transporter periplasmic adaptor subunit n=1 Tax=Fusobacterium perfoetens TaxID=852 RepID=UPI0004819DC5|nr:efflux RND transporter periplasmic adaptor subunit [Fusobacterium perfoetens]